MAESGMAVSSALGDLATDAGLQEAVDAFSFGPEGVARLTEETFLALPPALLAERCNSLIESCRRSPRQEGVGGQVAKISGAAQICFGEICLGRCVVSARLFR